MSALVMLDAEVLAGPVRLSGVTNEVNLDLEADEKDVTVWTSGGWTAAVPGLRKAMVDVSGFFDASPPETGALTPDAELFNTQFAGAQVPVTTAATSADLSTAYIFPGMRGSLSLFGKIGEVAPFSSKVSGQGLVARGQLIHPATVLRTAGGTGSTAILGTIPAGKTLLTAIHVVTVSGTSPQLTVTIQRDDNAGFSSPTTVTTNGPISAPQAFFFAVPGPIPDDRYRVTWTLTGTTPTARFAVAVGVTN
jgi:hypothetical protein